MTFSPAIGATSGRIAVLVRRWAGRRHVPDVNHRQAPFAEAIQDAARLPGGLDRPRERHRPALEVEVLDVDNEKRLIGCRLHRASFPGGAAGAARTMLAPQITTARTAAIICPLRIASPSRHSAMEPPTASGFPPGTVQIQHQDGNSARNSPSGTASASRNFCRRAPR